MKPLVGKQVEPRSVLGEEDSTVPSEAIAAVICGSLESAGMVMLRLSQVVHFLIPPAMP